MKSLYYQFVNFIQRMNPFVFAAIWVVLLGLTFMFIIKFFNSYDNDKKRYKKTSFLIIGILIMAVLIFLTYLRK